MKALREGLAALGYIEGKNIVIEERQLEGAYDQVQLAELAAQLVDLKPDIIVAHGPAVLAANTRRRQFLSSSRRLATPSLPAS